MWELNKKFTIPSSEEVIRELIDRDMIMGKSVTIVTDGSCSGNPGPGGWCCILLKPTSKTSVQVLVKAGKLEHSTNNIAELIAIEEGIKALTQNVPVIFVGDSNYANGAALGHNRVKANREIVYRIRNLIIKKAPDFTSYTVIGHDKPNEKCLLIMYMADSQAVLQSGSGGRI